MQKAITAMFERYADAEAAVVELELIGVTGGQVEVISDVDEDMRTASAKNGPPKNYVRDTSGEQPEYIGEQEYYATHVRQGQTVLIVRVDQENIATQASEILKNHGAQISGRYSNAPKPLTGDESSSASTPGIGANRATQGGSDRDLEARGQQFKKAAQ
jgi:hypothetical protein